MENAPFSVSWRAQVSSRNDNRTIALLTDIVSKPSLAEDCCELGRPCRRTPWWLPCWGMYAGSLQARAGRGDSRPPIDRI